MGPCSAFSWKRGGRIKTTGWGEGLGRLDAAGSTGRGQQPASAGPQFGSSGLRNRDRYQLGRTDVERSLPHATAREEAGGRGAQIRIGFAIAWVFLKASAFTDGRNFSGLVRKRKAVSSLGGFRENPRVASQEEF